MFRAFRYSMGRYDYFGGDKVFNKAKEAIISKINGYQSEYIPSKTAVKYITNELSFITDCHCRIGNVSPFYDLNEDDMVHYSYSSGLILQKDNEGYYEKDNKDNRYLGCDNNNAFVSSFIDESGSACYSVILYCSANEFDPSSIAFFTNGNQKINWSENGRTEISTEEKKYIESGNIAYVGLSKESGNGYGKFYSDLGSKAKNKDIVIIDIRGNGGVTCYDFLKEFTRKSVSIAQLAIERQTMLSHWKLEKGWERTIRTGVTQTGKTASIPNLVIILTDNKSGCASEEFSQYCRMFDYAFVVGSSTHGHLDGGSGYDDEGVDTSKYDMLKYSLPNSGIPFNFSNAMSYFGKYESRMGLGFKPDFYVEDTSTALNTVLKLLVKCGLTDATTADVILNSSGEKQNQASSATEIINKGKTKKSNLLNKAYEEYAGFIDNSGELGRKCSKCSNAQFCYNNKHYECTACHATTIRSNVQAMLQGIWTTTSDSDCTLFISSYKEPCNGIAYRDIVAQSTDNSPYFRGFNETEGPEFIEFDDMTFYFNTVSNNEITATVRIGEKEYEDVILTRKRNSY